MCLGIVGSWARSRRVKSELRRISDPNIYRTANLLIDQRGEDASIRATERADDLLEAGDTEGAAIWRAIMAAIEELQRAPKPDEAVNG